MKIKQTLLKTSAFLALCALSTASSATVISTVDMVSFNFDSIYVLENGSGLAVGESDYRRVLRDVQTVSLDRFDETLGALLDVDIWFETNWSLKSTVYSKDSSHRRMASAAGRSVNRMAVRMTDPSGDTEINREVLRANCQGESSCMAQNYDSGEFNEHLDLSDFTLANFIGTDDLNFRVSRNLIADLTRCGRYDHCGSRNSHNAWSGNIFVSYLYDDDPVPVQEEPEVDVPEPSTLVLLGLGLLGIGAIRLSSKKNI